MPGSKSTVVLTGEHLTRADVAAVAQQKVRVILDADRLQGVQRTADFLAGKVQCGEPIYGVTTGFGSNADKLLGAHRVRDELSNGNSRKHDNTLLEELQRNLIVTHAVCVGKPFAPEVVRAMLVIRINTLMRGHSGIRASTLLALAQLLERDVIPVIPEKGSVGASGDLAPLSHLAMVLIGEGEAFYNGERLSGAQALKRAQLQPVVLSFKEGLALNNGTTQMLACAVLALNRLELLTTSSWMLSATSSHSASSMTSWAASSTNCRVVNRCCPSMTDERAGSPEPLWSCFTTTAPRKWLDSPANASRSPFAASTASATRAMSSHSGCHWSSSVQT